MSEIFRRPRLFAHAFPRAITGAWIDAWLPTRDRHETDVASRLRQRVLGAGRAVATPHVHARRLVEADRYLANGTEPGMLSELDATGTYMGFAPIIPKLLNPNCLRAVGIGALDTDGYTLQTHVLILRYADAHGGEVWWGVLLTEHAPIPRMVVCRPGTDSGDAAREAFNLEPKWYGNAETPFPADRSILWFQPGAQPRRNPTRLVSGAMRSLAALPHVHDRVDWGRANVRDVRALFAPEHWHVMPGALGDQPV